MNEFAQEMPTKERAIENYTDQIKKVAFNTFETTCYMFPLEEWELEDSEDIEEQDLNVRAVVEFDGAAQGCMVLSATLHLVEAIAVNMLGIEEASKEEKEGALGEIANIICGNIVPAFAKNDEICYILPPRIAKKHENFEELYSNSPSEHVEVILDEGVAHISIYYKTESN